MVNGKLRAGVIGLGLGSNHAYAYNKSSQYDLVGVSEISSNVVDNFWDKAKISKGTVPIYDDYKEMIEKENLDFQIFYGVSNNKWRFWDLDHARKTIGYEPKQNAENER